MQQLPATVSSSASTEESLPVRREIGDTLIHSMTHQRHENFYIPVAVRGGSVETRNNNCCDVIVCARDFNKFVEIATWES